jgi:hypothetical protein
MVYRPNLDERTGGRPFHLALALPILQAVDAALIVVVEGCAYLHCHCVFATNVFLDRGK